MNHATVSERYREMAIEIRELIPLLLHSESIADLRLLATRYDRLAEYLKEVSPDVPLQSLASRLKQSLS